jgi:hypothetical protein
MAESVVATVLVCDDDSLEPRLTPKSENWFEASTSNDDSCIITIIMLVIEDVGVGWEPGIHQFR